ncbi:unnamed protein product [Allacma fusca]|uniref:Bromodomain and PHD finger-containing protein n=1 Tax=Allacma fusca TaxID=39272 RepID=A0A8J2KQZ7_9HEXA|nr:unnamed protein product [Allacma fusca]
MQKSEINVSTETPKSRTPKSAPKKKSSSQKALMGHKWFKGSPKSRSNHKLSKKLLKSPPVEKTPQKPPTPYGVVEFDFGGVFDRISVFDPISCFEQDDDVFEYSFGSDPTDLREDTPGNSLISVSNNSAKGRNLSREKAKDTPKGRTLSHKKDSVSVQRKSKTPNAVRNLGKSVCDSETRKKTPPLSKLPEACFDTIKDFKISDAPPMPVGYIRYMEVPQEELADEVEYDLDGEDHAWLTFVNNKRKEHNLQPVKFSDMELLMDRLEKESYFQMQSTGIDQGALIDDDAVCCICMDGECQNSNAILFCDMCNLAVHQECYGVPYIPEGQWLCRRCLQSPSRAVDCALCPNKGGAFKQTDDGRWAHVVCAIWIPEVCFANTVFLEPVDSIGNIPPARWRLVCFICKQKGVGACIQCHKSNCYIAFHVTCAQQAGLCMKMDTVRESSSVTVKKTAYCDNHAPPDSDFGKDVDGSPSPRQKMRQARKLLAEKRSAVPVLSIPTIPDERVAEIAQTVLFSRKNQFIKRLMAYWKLKRQSRNGVPLLRRLQAASTIPHPPTRDVAGVNDASQTEEAQTYYRYWLRLRQDLERARLLCELVRKREKVKKELIYLKCREVEIRLRPFSMFLLNVLEEIQAKDVQEIFAKPVDTEEVPDYLDVVDCPMDLSTMKEKINSFQYNNIEDFEADFNLMIENCLNYNSKDTVFYRHAVRLRELGGIIIRHARRGIEAIGFDTTTGLHLPERNHVPVVLTDDQIVQKVENLWSDESRFDLPFDKHLELLNEALDDTLALSHAATRKKKFLKIKHEIVRVRRMKHSKHNKLSSKSPLKQKYNRKESAATDSETDELQDLAEKSKHRARLRLSQDRSSTGERSVSSSKRTLRPSKRKRDPSPSPTPTRSPSPRVLRGTKPKVENQKPPPQKKSRRKSATPADLAPPPMSTPTKGRNKTNLSSSSVTNNDLKKQSSLSPGGVNKITVALRDREGIKLRDRESVSKSSPAKTPTKPGSTSAVVSSPGTNRRNTVLLTKKINATLQENCAKSLESPSKSAASSSGKVSAQKLKTPPKKLSVLNNNSVGTVIKSVKSPPRRNSTRTRKTATVNNVTINNNVITSNDHWTNNNSVHTNNSNFNNNFDGNSLSGSPQWNNSASFTKTSNNNANINHASSTNSTSNSKRKKRANSPVISQKGYTSVTTSAVSNSSGAENQALTGSQYSNRVVTTTLGNNNRTHAKLDSFSVYRSGKDMDLNSEDDEDDEKEEEDQVNQNSDDESTDNDESVDGSQESESDEEGSSSGSKSRNSSESSSSGSESDSSYQSSTKPSGYEMRRNPRNENVLNHKQGNQNENNRRVNNENDEDEEDDDEELVLDNHVQLNVKFRLQPLDLVWAKCKEVSWYPALIINPDLTLGITQNDVSIPGPPPEVLLKRPRNPHENYFLVLCFDSKRTWEWIPRSHLEPLGQDPKTDQGYLMTRKSDKRSLGAVRKAYEKAILHRTRVNGTDRRMH